MCSSVLQKHFKTNIIFANIPVIKVVLGYIFEYAYLHIKCIVLYAYTANAATMNFII